MTRMIPLRCEPLVKAKRRWYAHAGTTFRRLRRGTVPHPLVAEKRNAIQYCAAIPIAATDGEVRRRVRLSGLLNDYFRGSCPGSVCPCSRLAVDLALLEWPRSRPTRGNKPNRYLLGSYRIATAPDPNCNRLTSLKSTGFDSPANNVGP